MEIVYKKINELKPYENNSRTHDESQIKQICESIKEYGWTNPVLIDEKGMIIAGHGRVEAGKKLDIKEVPCIVLSGLTEAQKKAYVIADNKMALNAGWNEELLKTELENLKELDFDLELTGFNIDELDELFKEDEEEQEIIEDDFDVEPPEEPKAKLGDIYQLGNHRLMCGDSTSIDDVEKLINNKKLDLALTDLPYGIDVVGDNGEVGADFGVAKKGNYKKVIADDTTETAQQSYDILSVYTERQIIWGGNYFTNFLPFSDGWIIWDKRVDSGIRNTFADGEMAWCSFHTPIRIYHQLWNGMIREGEKEKRVHPTQKPIRMLSDILKDFSKENDDILDLFGGSGSTLIACEQLNRKCFMMELDPKYVDVIIKRWEEFTGKKAIKVEGERI